MWQVLSARTHHHLWNRFSRARYRPGSFFRPAAIRFVHMTSVCMSARSRINFLNLRSNCTLPLCSPSSTGLRDQENASARSAGIPNGSPKPVILQLAESCRCTHPGALVAVTPWSRHHVVQHGVQRNMVTVPFIDMTKLVCSNIVYEHMFYPQRTQQR